jgi:predicted alpha/beta superfamily hydrolase
LFVNPGRFTGDIPENAFRSSNRLAEYDELSDRYVTFLINELIPELEKKYSLAQDPKMRAIAGLSSEISVLLPLPGNVLTTLIKC